MADSGALLSTCAGAGATLVAIVGGLLVSRYLTLESEALSARKLVKTLHEKLDSARDQAEESQREHERFTLRELLTDDDMLQHFLAAGSAGERLEVDTVAAEVELTEFSEATVDEAIRAFNAEAKRVLAFDWSLVPHSNDHDYWYEFGKKHGVHPEIEEMWEFLYIKLCKQRPAPPQGGMFSVPVMDMATLGIVSIPEQNRSRDLRNRLIDARDADRAVARRLEAELAAAVLARDSLEQPPGLVLGLAVLVFLTITSVIVPVLLLAPTPAALSYRESVVVVGLFVAGILVLFLYLGSHVYRLLRAPALADGGTT